MQSIALELKQTCEHSNPAPTQAVDDRLVPGTLACEQALRVTPAEGWKRKESSQLRFWNLNICIEKVDAKC